MNKKGGEMRAKRYKNASDRGPESAQLEKNNFSTSYYVCTTLA